MRLIASLLAGFAAVQLSAAPGATPQMPSAIFTDPPADPVHPASTLTVEIPSHAAVMNGMVYRPSGPGPFPLVILMHGLPGNEQNMDLAQALRRAGWAVLTFHYRGSWGSDGDFSIDHVLEDADAAATFARNAGKAWNIDPTRIVLMGHSMGGLATAHATAAAPDRLATVLIAPWDPSILATLLRPMSAAERDAFALDRWGDVSHGRLRGISAEEIAGQIVDHGERWRLANSAPTAASRPLLIITAHRDLASNQAGGLKAALTAKQARFDTIEIDSNHSFEDHRIALESAVLDWLEQLPGAPHR